MANVTATWVYWNARNQMVVLLHPCSQKEHYLQTIESARIRGWSSTTIWYNNPHPLFKLSPWCSTSQVKTLRHRVSLVVQLKDILQCCRHFVWGFGFFMRNWRLRIRAWSTMCRLGRWTRRCNINLWRSWDNITLYSFHHLRIVYRRFFFTFWILWITRLNWIVRAVSHTVGTILGDCWRSPCPRWIANMRLCHQVIPNTRQILWRISS